jgi:hypothetical protein
MTRRWSTGKYRAAPPMASVPLLEHAYARRVKRASNVKGEATKRTRHRAKVMLVCAMLRAEAAAWVAWF